MRERSSRLSSVVSTLSLMLSSDISSYNLGGSISGWYSSVLEMVPKLSFCFFRRACSFFFRSLFMLFPNYTFFCSYWHWVLISLFYSETWVVRLAR
jgi:hypothetical protein